MGRLIVVFDSSAVIAAIRREPGHEQATASLDTGLISTANLAEVVDVLHRNGLPEEAVRTSVSLLRLVVIPPDEAMAIDAGFLRTRLRPIGLSLGDCLCLALARRVEAPVLTADRPWARAADIASVEIRLIR